jgi:hypothetical protein
MNIEKPTLAEKQAFWTEHLPLFKEAYWLHEHFELLKFDMEVGNFVVRDDIDPSFEDDADDLYHRINTGWSMWKRAVNHMQKKLEGCVVVPEKLTHEIVGHIVSKVFHDCCEDVGVIHEIHSAMVEAARGGNE